MVSWVGKCTFLPFFHSNFFLKKYILSDDDIQMDLLDILGLGNMELIEKLLSQRSRIVEKIMENVSADQLREN